MEHTHINHTDTRGCSIADVLCAYYCQSQNLHAKILYILSLVHMSPTGELFGSHA